MPKIKKEVIIVARQKIGEYLKGIRLHRKLSIRSFETKVGLKHEAVVAIEKGSKSYTIDNFLAYTSALDCYFFLADKEDHHLDFEHMQKQSDNPI